MTESTPTATNPASIANLDSPGELLPPRELQDWVGLGGAPVFKATGNEFLGYLVNLCGLQPGDSMLDVGCGSGRMALPLTGYLNLEGRYTGFDVAREPIAWCLENIAPSHPNFKFSVIDVQSKRYNPNGRHQSSEFRFPYPDASFDVVLLASIFTHMLPADVRQYMREIVRVLKPGGRSLITFFLLNEESLALGNEGKGVIKFEHEIQGARTANLQNPEAAIAYPETFVRDLYSECGLELEEPLRYGNWCGRTEAMSGQDILVSIKGPGRASSLSEGQRGQGIADAENTVRGLYRYLLDRTPGQQELEGWSAYARQAPSVLDLVEGFISTEEYKSRLRTAPIKDDLPSSGKWIEFGDSGLSEEIIGPGWSLQDDALRWMTGKFSVLALPTPQGSTSAEYVLMLRVTPYTANGQIEYQRCTIVCGSETVAELKLGLHMSTWIGFHVPSESLLSEKLTVLFVHPDAGSPRHYGIASDSRELAIAVHEIVLLPVVAAHNSAGAQGAAGQFVSCDWRAQGAVPDWKSLASKFQSLGQDCEFGIVQRQFDAEPLGLFRFCQTWLHGLIQGLRNDFSDLADKDKLNIYPSPSGEYFGEFKDLDLSYHTLIPTDENLNVDALRSRESTRLKMMARLFIEDLEDGEKIFVLLRKIAPLDECEVLPLISLMRRYNSEVALLWIVVAEPDQRHLVGQCEIVGDNLLKGYIDHFSLLDEEKIPIWSTLSLESWKNIMISALQALGKPIPFLPRDLPPEEKQLI